MEYPFSKGKFSIENFEGLIRILNEDAGEELNAYTSNNRLFVSGNVSNTCLMLRYGSDVQLVIANIELKHQRVGTGGRILQWCEGFAFKNNFTIVLIESALTMAMENFVQKNGFKKRGNKVFDKDWIKQI